ncbi:YueI family protein [Bacillus testis]|uniref:YueI family protein n=1 Tax=Bacillus testis TaxID=1622072 RepID=UPI0008411F2E|nr:YueI family protein [Bacillus testis]
MASKNVDDYIEQGIHGPKEINPAERRKFLGTLRERIVLAMTIDQVMENNVYKETEDALKANKDATLFLNGEIAYEHLSKYIKIAKGNDVDFTIVNNQEHVTEIGLVLAHSYAIDKEHIYISSGSFGTENGQEHNNLKKKGFSLLKWLKN